EPAFGRELKGRRYAGGRLVARAADRRLAVRSLAIHSSVCHNGCSLRADLRNARRNPCGRMLPGMWIGPRSHKPRSSWSPALSLDGLLRPLKRSRLTSRAGTVKMNVPIRVFGEHFYP